MGKKKQKAASVKSRLLHEEALDSPFKNIELKQKAEVTKKPVSPPPRKKSEIIGGYDPRASFSDILFAYEHTGEPYVMPKAEKQRAIREKETDFGSILDQWEKGKLPGTNVKKQIKQNVSAPYKASRSFGDILSQYEGKRPSEKNEVVKSVKKEKKQSPKAPSHAVAKSSYTPTEGFGDILDAWDGKKSGKDEKPVQTPSPQKRTETMSSSVPAKDCIAPPESTSFFKTPEEGESRAKEAVWSILGDNKPVVREPKPEKEDETVVENLKEEVKCERVSAPYVPTKDFGEILSSYKAPETAPLQVKKAEAHKPDTARFFRHDDDTKRSEDATWSILGGNKEVKRDAPVIAKTPLSVPDTGRVSAPYEPHEDFGSIYEQYEKTEEESFEDILAKKGETAVKDRAKTIGELRLMMPEATLDMHGMTEVEGEAALTAFLAECKKNQLEKISVIHGKGIHSADGVGILKATTLRVLSSSGVVREYYAPKAQYGGSGALWIILKGRETD